MDQNIFFRFVNLHAAKLGQFGKFWCIFGSDFALIIFLILQILIKSKMYARVLVVLSFFEERPIIVHDVGPFVCLSVRRSKYIVKCFNKTLTVFKSYSRNGRVTYRSNLLA